MSESTWREFLAAEGLEDWAVLHGGATAVYVTGSLGESLRVAAAIGTVPGFAGSRAAITIVDGQVTVRLVRDVWALEGHHIDLARAISAAAQGAGAVADLSRVQEVQVAVSAKAGEINLPFWRAVLGYEAVADDNGADPLGTSSVVWMQTLKEDKALRHAMHIDVSVPRGEVEARVAAAVAAGGVIVAQDEAPEMWILADSAGNKVCVCAWPDGAEASPRP